MNDEIKWKTPEECGVGTSLHFSSQRELLIKAVTFLVSTLGITAIFVSGWKADIASRKPIIQQIGVPIYITNTIHSIVIIPTNSVPLTNVVEREIPAK